MAHQVKPVPDGYHTVTATLNVHDGARALEFYAKALGAKERMRSTAMEGKVTHAEIQIGDSVIMISEEIPAMGNKSPKTLGGTVGGVWLYVPDADALYHRALAAGATSVMEPVDMFWGDRTSRIRDPFGHEWSISTHQEDVPPAELEKRAKEFYARLASRPARGPSSA
jgi:PhnB protein